MNKISTPAGGNRNKPARRPARPARQMPESKAGTGSAAATPPASSAQPAAAQKPGGKQAPARRAARAEPQNTPCREAAQAGQTAPEQGEKLSFRRELLSLLPGLRAFAVSLAGNKDRADDLLQDTIMRAWGKQDSFTMGTNMKAWLFTILRNEFYSQIRKQKREIQDTDGFYANNIAVRPAQYGSLDLQDFKRALDKLPPDQREAIILIGASGFSYEEAAEICRCAIGTIKSRVSRARSHLQTLLG